MKAISIKQPWASLIVDGIKDIENRTWKCPEKYIGERILIHAGISKSEGFICLNASQRFAIRNAGSFLIDCKFEDLPFGAIIGSVNIVDCVKDHPSIWAQKGCYNWVLEDPTLYEEPIPVKGKLSFWNFDDIHEVKIECPECGTIQPALIDCTTLPWDTYVHECKQCHYIITESDWEEVKEANNE